MDIQLAVQQELNTLIESGQVATMIQNQLAKTIASVLNDSLRDYSDFGKKLKDEISKSLDIDLSKLNMLDYNSIVANIIKEQLDATIYTQATESINTAIKGYLGTLDKKEWKLSEIVAKLIDMIKEDGSDGEIDLKVHESDYGSIFIGIDKEKERRSSRHDSEFQLSLDKKTGRVYSFQAGKYKPTRGDWRESPVHGSFDEFLFKLYAMECTVIVDEDNCETSWSAYD